MPAALLVLEKCPLCGHAFHADAERCRPACPLAKGCHMTCCPQCGYGFPQEHAGLAGVLKRALTRLGSRS
jgi:hypothetical protein